MKVKSTEVYLFRMTQVLALLLYPLLVIFSVAFILFLFLFTAVVFVLIGFMAMPLLLSLIVFDLISDFSRSRFRDPVGRYIDLLLMIPEVIWGSLRKLYDKNLLLLRRIWSYARE